MISIATVCNVYDEPAVPISVHTDSILTGLRVKSMGTGRTMESDLCHPTVHGDRVYIPVPGFDIGDRVVFDITGTLRWSDLDVSPSAIREGWVVISPYSLQNAISSRNTDIKILSVGPVPEIEL